MEKDRINNRITLGEEELATLLSPLVSPSDILGFRAEASMSNTGYTVSTRQGKLFLKLYSKNTDQVEMAALRYLSGTVRTPALYLSDASREKVPFAYTVSEYIEGVPLVRFLRETRTYPPELAYMTGQMCAAIHARTYPNDALLDGNLEPESDLPATREGILRSLSGRPGTRISAGTVVRLRIYIAENPSLFDVIEGESVLCHGDLGYSNVLVSHGEICLIDFEFSRAGSRYHDIGHFFRRKDPEIEVLIDSAVQTAFAEGYSSRSANLLPPNWRRLADLCDINAMLCLLNHENAPEEWVTDIEADILRTISE